MVKVKQSDKIWKDDREMSILALEKEGIMIEDDDYTSFGYNNSIQDTKKTLEKELLIAGNIEIVEFEPFYTIAEEKEAEHAK